MARRLFLLVWILIGSGFNLFPSPTAAQSNATQLGDTPLVLVLKIEGPVMPPMREYLSRGIHTAERRGADLLIFQLSTPGGAVTTMNEMVQIIRASRVPVVVYVSPRGAMAASAGTILTIAGHASAMAPETIIGAASPIDVSGQDLNETAASKEKNALKATVRTLMENRPEEAIALAEETVETAVAISAKQALEVGMIDFIASDLQDLLAQLDGYTVQLGDAPVTLHTADAQVVDLNLSLIEQILMTLTNPNIVFLLITIGVQSVLIELSSPGGWIAGFVGVVCLALATYGLGVLPVNWFGLIFLATAFVLFILDVKAPTHGALTATGIGSLVVGALILFNSPGTPSFQRVSVPLVVVTSLFSALIFFTIVSFAIRAQLAPVRTGQESLVGKKGIVRQELNPMGTVHLNGELWTAEVVDWKGHLEEGTEAIPVGTRVVVERVEGVRLLVRKVN